MNKYERLFNGFLETTDFELVRYETDEDGKCWGVIDKQGGNLGNIEGDRFSSAEEIFERMDVYINDYFIMSLEECLEEAGHEVPDWSCYMDLVNYCRPLLPENQWDLDVVEMICEHFEEINLESCFVSNKYTIEYCPFCDNEVVIFSKGVTACPECGKPLAPCSMCEDCNYEKCPYGCTGCSEDEFKEVTNPTITREESQRLYKFL